MTIQTQSQAAHDLRLAARQGLLPARGSGWLAGFGNMLSKELGEWFRTRRWLVQLSIWLFLINGFIGFILFVLPMLNSTKPVRDQMSGAIPPETQAFVMYFTIAVMGGTIGVIILAQDEIIQEKQSGTAAWILSKPASRSTFILTKLLSNAIGALVFIVGLPGLVTLGESYLATHQAAPLGPFLAGVGVVMLALVFYLSLVILLGVMCESRGRMLGIAFGLMFGGMLLNNLIPQLNYVLPVNMDKIAQALFLGVPLPAMFVSQVIAAAVLSIVFILAALWRFHSVEL